MKKDYLKFRCETMGDNDSQPPASLLPPPFFMLDLERVLDVATLRNSLSCLKIALCK